MNVKRCLLALASSLLRWKVLRVRVSLKESTLLLVTRLTGYR
jgi:hypothetical protein